MCRLESRSFKDQPSTKEEGPAFDIFFILCILQPKIGSKRKALILSCSTDLTLPCLWLLVHITTYFYLFQRLMLNKHNVTTLLGGVKDLYLSHGLLFSSQSPCVRRIRFIINNLFSSLLHFRHIVCLTDITNVFKEQVSLFQSISLLSSAYCNPL